MVKRYDISIDHYDWDASRLCFEEDKEGEWVKFSDLSKHKLCLWVKPPMNRDIWQTECGNDYLFPGMDSGPGLNGFLHCPYCGGRLVKEY